MRKPHGIIAAHVGVRLRELRGDLTQKEFARRLDLTQVQYNRYETGKRLAPDQVLERLGEMNQTPPEDLFFPLRLAPAKEEEHPPDFSRAVARLSTLLDDQGREDLYYFLKAKTENLSQKQKSGLKAAAQALETLRRKAG